MRQQRVQGGYINGDSIRGKSIENMNIEDVSCGQTFGVKSRKGRNI